MLSIQDPSLEDKVQLKDRLNSLSKVLSTRLSIKSLLKCFRSKRSTRKYLLTETNFPMISLENHLKRSIKKLANNLEIIL